MTTSHRDAMALAIRNWPLHKPDVIASALERLRLDQPKTMTLTINMKLRVSREKIKLLRNAHTRITCMKSDVLTLLQGDLQRLAEGATDDRLISEIVGIAKGLVGRERPDTHIINSLSAELAMLKAQGAGVHFSATIVTALAKATKIEKPGLYWLSGYLDTWYSKQKESLVDKTLRSAAEAQRKRKTTQNGVESVVLEPLYTVEQLQIIRHSLLLRKLMQYRLESRATATNIVRLAEQIEQCTSQPDEQERLINAVMRRSTGRASDALCKVITEAVAALPTVGEKAEQHLSLLPQALEELLKTVQRQAKSQKASTPSRASGQQSLLIYRIIAAIADETSSDQGSREVFRWLRSQLNSWTAKDILPAKDSVSSSQQLEGRLHYATVLRHLIESTAPPMTDVLLGTHLAEKRVRGIGDNAMTLSDILSSCYSSTLSVYKYPLSSILRGGVFNKCAENVVGWAQKVLDDLDNRGVAIPQNRSPTSTEEARKKVVVSTRLTGMVE